MMSVNETKYAVSYSDTDLFEKEILRLRHKRKMKYSIITTVSVFVLAVAMAAIFSTVVYPVMKITGNSMSPTYNAGDIVVTHGGEIKRGDVITFNLGSKKLVKRVIALPGDTVNIESDGTVYINDEKLSEEYVLFLTPGTGDTEYPIMVPEDSYFVLGDNRESSIDSRYSEVGMVPFETAGTKVLFRIWPLI